MQLETATVVQDSEIAGVCFGDAIQAAERRGTLTQRPWNQGVRDSSFGIRPSPSLRIACVLASPPSLPKAIRIIPCVIAQSPH